MKVRKRDGRLVNFNESKIINAIQLASENTKSDNKITDEQLMVAERRETSQASLEGFVLCMIVNGQLIWDENIMNGKWFWQSQTDPDLVLLRNWVEGK